MLCDIMEKNYEKRGFKMFCSKCGNKLHSETEKAGENYRQEVTILN